MAPVVASSQRLTLQVFSVPEHFEAYYELEMDPEVTKWSSNPPFKHKEEVLEKLNNRRPTPEKPWSQTWAICLKPEDPNADEGSGKFVGAIGLPREIDVGYRISRAYWGKGYMTEALVMFVDMFWKSDGKIVFYFSLDLDVAYANPENEWCGGCD
jgi:ribosomal-protein-alanine N-acetyltransferase